MEHINELIEKWVDVEESTEDFTEKTLANEMIEDLQWLLKVL